MATNDDTQESAPEEKLPAQTQSEAPRISASQVFFRFLSVAGMIAGAVSALKSESLLLLGLSVVLAMVWLLVLILEIAAWNKSRNHP